MAKRRPAPAERRQAFYSGHVQGVGFRYTVSRLAENYDVAGFVRNLPDGRVELVAEGAPAELDQFLKAVAERMAGHIRKTTIDARPALGEFDGFEIF